MAQLAIRITTRKDLTEALRNLAQASVRVNEQLFVRADADCPSNAGGDLASAAKDERDPCLEVDIQVG